MDNPIDRWEISGNQFYCFGILIDDNQALVSSPSCFGVSIFSDNTVVPLVGLGYKTFKNGGRQFNTARVAGNSDLTSWTPDANNKETLVIENLVLQSESLITAPWVVDSGITAQSAVDPFGTTRAWRILSDGYGSHFLNQPITFTNQEKVFIKFWAKKGASANSNTGAEAGATFAVALYDDTISKYVNQFDNFSLGSNWKHYSFTNVIPNPAHTYHLRITTTTYGAYGKMDGYIFAPQVSGYDCDYVPTTTVAISTTNIGSRLERPLEIATSLNLNETTTPVTETNKGKLYVADVSGYSELYYLDDHGNQVEITKQGTTTLQNRKVSSAVPADGYILAWNNSASTWTPQIQDAYRLQNRKISTAAPTDGYAYIWNNSTLQWEPNRTIAGITLGTNPLGSSASGITGTSTAKTLGLVSLKSNGANNISNAIVADINSASLDPDHKVLSIGWVNDSDVYTELFAFKDGQIVYSNVTGGIEYWSTEADGSSVTAFIVGSTNRWVTPGAKLFSVVNADPFGIERAYIDYAGTFYSGSGFLSTGIQPAGITDDYGIATTNTSHVLSLWGTRTSGAGNISTALVADVNAASINTSHKITSFQWISNADVATEVAYVRADGYVHSELGFDASKGWNLGATYANGLTLTNSSPAAAGGGSQQNSPSIVLGGRGWKSDAPAASQPVLFSQYVIPVEGAAAASATWYLASTLNNGAQTTVVRVTATGVMYVTSTMSCASVISGSSIEARNQTYIDGVDLSTGLGICASFYSGGNRPVLLGNTALTDAASAKVAVTCYARNAASITNASTIRIHSFGWSNNAAAYTELAYVRADGLIYGALGFDSSKAWAIGATPTDGLTLDNTSAATVGAQQYSPAIHLGGNAWETTGGTSQSIDWRIYNLPVQGATASSNLRFDYSINGGAYSTPLVLSSAGVLDTVKVFVSTWISAGSSSGNPNTFLTGGTADSGFGLGIGSTLWTQVAGGTLQLGHYGRTDGASNIVIASSYYRGAASITNAATMRIHSFGWVNNAAAYVELQYMRADGAFVCASGSFSAGILPAGMSTDFGIATTAATDTLSMWSIRTNGSGNISNAIVADINNATLHADHKVLSLGWVNDADVYTELFAFKDGQIQYSNITGGLEFWSDEADGGAVTAFTVGSTATWTTPGAKLLSVVNGDPSGKERANVDYAGNLTVNEGDNSQSLTIKSLTELYTVPAAVDGYLVNQVPAGAIVVAVSARVTTVIPTATTFSVGVVGGITRYINGANVAAGTTNPGTADGLRYYAAAQQILVRPSTTPGAATGVIRATIHYIEIIPPKS